MAVRIALLLSLLCLVGREAEAVEHVSAAAGYRFVGLPDFIVDQAFSDHQPVMLQGVLAEVSFGKRKAPWNIGLVGGWTSIPDGYWRAEGAAVATAVYMEFDLGFIGLYGGKTWNLPLGRNIVFSPTVGLGLGYVLGDLYATEVVPGCETEVTGCHHWNAVTRQPVEFTSRLLPLLIAELALAYHVTPALTVTLDAGIFDLFSVGLDVSYRF
jgi:hypothetical protein